MKDMSSTIKIIESHISEWALPKEEIVSWIKWEKDFDFDQIIIKTEADINLHRIINVEPEILKQEGIKNGKVVIAKTDLQIDGFIGFECFYELVPETERELSFEVEFNKNDKILNVVNLKTNLIRPIVTVENLAHTGIVITKDNPVLPEISFRIVSKGQGRILKLTPFIELVNAKDMKITIKQIVENVDDEKPLFVYSTEKVISKFMVEGKGYGMISMGYQYTDSMNNKYESKLIDIPIQIEQKENLEIPILSDLKGQSTILLEPKIA